MNTAAETKGTAGPWIVGPFGQVWPASDISLVDGKWRENVPEPRIVASLTDPADGPLVAAAPDLYEALKYMSDLFKYLGGTPTTDTGWKTDEMLDVYERAAVALAKARGEAR